MGEFTDSDITTLIGFFKIDTVNELITELAKLKHNLPDVSGERIHVNTLEQYLTKKKAVPKGIERKFIGILKAVGFKNFSELNFTDNGIASAPGKATTQMEEETISIPLGISKDHHEALCGSHSLVGVYRILRMTIAANKREQYVREKLTIVEDGNRVEFELESKKASGGVRVYNGSVALFRNTLTFIGVYQDGVPPTNSLRVLTLFDEGGQKLAEHHRIRWGMLTTGIIGTRPMNGLPIARRILLEKPLTDRAGKPVEKIIPALLENEDIDEIYGDLADTVRELVGISDLTQSELLSPSLIDLSDAFCVDQSIIDRLTPVLVCQMDKRKKPRKHR